MRDFDLLPLVLLAALALLALPLVGSPSTWLTLTVAGLAMGMIVFIVASGLTAFIAPVLIAAIVLTLLKI